MSDRDDRAPGFVDRRAGARVDVDLRPREELIVVDRSGPPGRPVDRPAPPRIRTPPSDDEPGAQLWREAADMVESVDDARAPRWNVRRRQPARDEHVRQVAQPQRSRPAAQQRPPERLRTGEDIPLDAAYRRVCPLCGERVAWRAESDGLVEQLTGEHQKCGLTFAVTVKLVDVQVMDAHGTALIESRTGKLGYRRERPHQAAPGPDHMVVTPGSQLSQFGLPDGAVFVDANFGLRDGGDPEPDVDPVDDGTDTGFGFADDED